MEIRWIRVSLCILWHLFTVGMTRLKVEDKDVRQFSLPHLGCCSPGVLSTGHAALSCVALRDRNGSRSNHPILALSALTLNYLLVTKLLFHNTVCKAYHVKGVDWLKFMQGVRASWELYDTVMFFLVEIKAILEKGRVGKLVHTEICDHPRQIKALLCLQYGISLFPHKLSMQ